MARRTATIAYARAGERRLGNYVRLVQDPVFWLTLWNSIVWVFGSVAFQFVAGFAAALLLHETFVGRPLIRSQPRHQLRSEPAGAAIGLSIARFSCDGLLTSIIPTWA